MNGGELKNRGRRGTRLIVALELCAFALTALFLAADAARCKLALREETRERILAREETNAHGNAATSPTGISPVSTAEQRTAARRDRDVALVSAAERALAESNAPARRETVISGLARWDVAPELASAFISDEREAALFEQTSRLNARQKAFESRKSADEALAALERFQEETPGSEEDRLAFDAAVAFLKELGGANDCEHADSEEEFILWTLDAESRDPIDLAGFIRPNEYARVASPVAERARNASAALLVVLTLGVLVFPGAGSFFCARRFVLELVRAFMSTGKNSNPAVRAFQDLLSSSGAGGALSPHIPTTRLLI